MQLNPLFGKDLLSYTVDLLSGYIYGSWCCQFRHFLCVHGTFLSWPFFVAGGTSGLAVDALIVGRPNSGMKLFSKSQFSLKSGDNVRCFRIIMWVIGLVVVTFVVHEVSNGSGYVDALQQEQEDRVSKNAAAIDSVNSKLTDGHAHVSKNEVEHLKVAGRYSRRNRRRVSNDLKAKPQETQGTQDDLHKNEELGLDDLNRKNKLEIPDTRGLSDRSHVPKSKIRLLMDVEDDGQLSDEMDLAFEDAGKPIDRELERKDAKVGNIKIVDRMAPDTEQMAIGKTRSLQTSADESNNVCKDDSKFNIDVVTDSFDKGFDNLDVEAYITAYKELNRFV